VGLASLPFYVALWFWFRKSPLRGAKRLLMTFSTLAIPLVPVFWALTAGFFCLGRWRSS
jgi:hypothetical protein